MLSPIETSQYLRYLAQYKSGVRFQTNTTDYNVITLLETKEPRFTQSAREQNGVNVPSLTYIEFAPTPKPEGETTPRGENIFSLNTSTQPKPLPVGLPAGTTPIDTKTGAETTTTATTTNESFITKYKTPLIIGAVVLGYMLIKKK